MKMMTDVFICPSTGWGVFLVYDEEECELYARRLRRGRMGSGFG